MSLANGASSNPDLPWSTLYSLPHKLERYVNVSVNVSKPTIVV